MNSEMSSRLGRLAELNGRIREVASRLRHDIRLLAELQRDSRAWWRAHGRPRPSADRRRTPLPARMLRIGDVVERVGLARATIYQMANAGTFPTATPIGRGGDALAQCRDR